MHTRDKKKQYKAGVLCASRIVEEDGLLGAVEYFRDNGPMENPLETEREYWLGFMSVVSANIPRRAD